MRQGLEERPLLGLRRQREQLLELVDHQQQLAALGNHLPQGAVDAVDGRELRAPARWCRRPRSSLRLCASSLYGAPPGSIVATNQRVRPSAPPARSRGSRPARTALDLPVPEAPTRSTSRLR